MNENYTKGIQKILKISKDISLKMGHTYVGSEHLLLAIIIDRITLAWTKKQREALGLIS